MEIAHRQGLEALLFLAAEPVPVHVLAEALELDDALVEDLCQHLADSYRDEQRGLSVRRSGGGWRMYTAETSWPVVERHVLAGRTGRLSNAALETLAVVAYKQPITRSGVGEVRGVNADGAIRSLVARGYLTEVGREETAGQPVLYGTTDRFLEDLSLDALEQLPDLSDHLPDDAPDEPDDIRAARALLQRGGSLSADGSSDDDEDAADEARERRARDDASMEDLSSRLDRAARSAMAQLREAVSASEQDEQDGSADQADSEHDQSDPSDQPGPSDEHDPDQPDSGDDT